MRKDVEDMTTGQVRRLLWKVMDDLKAGRITADESAPLIKAAKKRLRDIRIELHADPHRFRELIGN